LCRKAFPEFQKVFDRYKDYPDVAFLAVNTSQGGDSIEKVRAFVENNKYTIRFAYDVGATVSSMLEIKYYPTLLVIDKSGNLRYKHIGFSDKLENYGLLLSNHIQQLISLNEF